MSSLQLYINNTLIPGEDVIEYPKSTEKLSEDGKVLPDSLEFIIDNVDKTKYDDRYSGSFFYATEWYGDLVELYDTDLGVKLFEGIQTDLQADDGKGTLKIEASNYFAYLKDRECVYSNSSDKTPAQIIYELLTDEDIGNISDDNIVYDGFQDAINVQTANSVYINVDYDAENKKNVLSIINELLRITQCALYSKKNLIYFYRWDEYSGEIGAEISGRDIFTKTFKQYYNDKNVFNSVSIAYDNSGTVAYATGSDSTSISLYGERKFSVPDEDVDSTSSSDFKILCRNATGAAYLADLVLQRYKNHKKMFEASIIDAMNYIEPGDQIDLNFDNFIREPGIIIEREYDRNKKEIKIKGEFLNLPVNYYSRDVEPPESVELISAISSGNGRVLLKWTKSTESDWLGYKIYFTSTPGMWWQEICNIGKSPLDQKNYSNY
jgi:hypothetical protein